MADQLRGWKEISNHLGVSERTAQRWGHELHLPVHRVRRGGQGPVFADVEELERWRQSADGVRAEAEERHSADATGTNGLTAAGSEAAVVPRLLAWPRRHPFVAWAVAGVIVSLVALAFLPGPWHRIAGTPRETVLPSVVPVDGRAVPTGSAIFTLRVTLNPDSVFTFREPEGGSATVTTADGAKYGVAARAGKDSLFVALAQFVRDPKGTDKINVFGSVNVPRGRATQVVYQGKTLFQLEWLNTSSAAPPSSSPADPPAPQCCIACAGRIIVCAAEVSSACGSCCGDGFEQCSKKPAKP